MGETSEKGEKGNHLEMYSPVSHVQQRAKLEVLARSQSQPKEDF